MLQNASLIVIKCLGFRVYNDLVSSLNKHLRKSYKLLLNAIKYLGLRIWGLKSYKVLMV